MAMYACIIFQPFLVNVFIYILILIVVLEYYFKAIAEKVKR